MNITIDRKSSGFCFGVQGTIDVAEQKLRESGKLYALGDVVHNEVEVGRLESLGLETISITTFGQLKDASVLVRAHGEPPSTYETARANNLVITDTTCPVVSRLQRTTRRLQELGFQVVIYGKKAHPEVIGLNGHSDNRAVIIKHADLSDPDELAALDPSRRSALISQTTMDVPGFAELQKNLEEKLRSTGLPWTEFGEADLASWEKGGKPLDSHVFRDTICRQVSNRNEQLREFARSNDCIIFVAGRKSSNGQVLYSVCREANPNSHFIEDAEELDPAWFMSEEGLPCQNVGVCGATSTPMWLLEKVADRIGLIGRI